MTVKRSRIKTLKIDGRDIGAHEDETILEVARENGIYIPSLCQLDGLSLVGSCRLCLVEVENWDKLLPACATYVEEGMVVNTNSDRVRKYRRMILELLFAEGNHVCAVCVSNGNCELQDLAQWLGMDHVRYPHLDPVRKVDMTHERFVIDANRCILCSRCVRVCSEIEGANTWDVFGRGINSRIISDFDTSWGESKTCSSCGKCVNVCPTGAIVEKGKASGEMIKRTEFLPYLTKMREVQA
ncbi:MAG: bidirectional hydrogenase complex protein HoxU [Anaerolineales bacterium]|nr:bidirectional hydrogenase complex protein HoxU [Anaerolineales bacterium]